jgi:hypothetical protein
LFDRHVAYPLFGVGNGSGPWQPSLIISRYNIKVYFCMCRYFFLILHSIVPGSRTPLAQKLFLFVTSTMAVSGFGPYHGLWCKDAQSKRIVVTPTSRVMMHALGLGIFTPQPKLYHPYSTANFHDFFVHNINMIANNNTILD